MQLKASDALHAHNHHARNAKAEAARGQRALQGHDFDRLRELANRPDRVDDASTPQQRAIKLTKEFGNETQVAVFTVSTKQRRLLFKTTYVHARKGNAGGGGGANGP